VSNHIAITRLSSRGQIVIPKEVRESLAWEAGDYVAVEVQGDRVILRRLILEEAIPVRLEGPISTKERCLNRGIT
jgi:AbrB family looped-hinge helix DNA binding protein